MTDLRTALEELVRVTTRFAVYGYGDLRVGKHLDVARAALAHRDGSTVDTPAPTKCSNPIDDKAATPGPTPVEIEMMAMALFGDVNKYTEASIAIRQLYRGSALRAFDKALREGDGISTPILARIGDGGAV